MCEQLGCQC
jgi:hypothetical protein